jgi:hypothetical protein
MPDGPGWPNQRIDPAPYSLSIESGSGAVGDVVGVSVMFESRILSSNGFFMMMPVCHDPEVAEMVGKPFYTDEFLSLLGPAGVQQIKVIEGSSLPGDPRGHGFFLIVDLNGEAYSARFPSDAPLTVMTVYYRILGTPGNTGDLSFCSGVLERAQNRCTYTNLIHGVWTDETHTESIGIEYLPENLRSGSLTVLEGPTTRPDPPPQPPDAKVYPRLLSAEEVNFRVRITGAQAVPGAKEVPVEVFITADAEYSAVQVPIDYDGRYLRLVHAEDRFLAGVVLFGDAPGAFSTISDKSSAVIYSGWGVSGRRLAAEGEEIPAATLYFDALEAASEIESTTIEIHTLESEGGGVRFPPWLGIRYENSQPGYPPVQAEVEPFRITEGHFNILGDVSYFIRGDSNRDFSVDLSDAVATLGYLFLGDNLPPCPDAADANDDGAVDVSDPVATLSSLFNGATELPAPTGRPGNDPTPDEIACR